MRLGANWSFQRPELVSCGFIVTVRATYRHGHQKVGRALLEAAYLRYEDRGNIGDDGLHNEDDGNDGEFGQLIGGQLGGELGEDWWRC